MLVFPGGSKYEPTMEDRLWLLRAVEAEGKPQESVARALVNLFGVGRANGERKTLAQLIRLYAQPVNPRWYPDGDLFLAKGPPSAAELAQAKRRKDILSTRNNFSNATVKAVDAALGSSYYGDVTDYAVYTLDASKKGYISRSAPQAGVNRLWTRKQGWGGYVVSTGSNLNGPAIGGLVAVAVVIYTVYKAYHG